MILSSSDPAVLVWSNGVWYKGKICLSPGFICKILLVVGLGTRGGLN